MKRLHPLLLAAWAVVSHAWAADRHAVLIAGTVSHGRGEHEFRAGCLLLARCLETVPGLRVTVVTNGWPSDASVLRSADAVVIYADGGDGHPAIKPDRLKLLDELAARGVGIGAVHYGVEVPTGDPGFAMLRWTGGFFEKFWSVNPTWTAEFTTLPDHPVTRGVKPFRIHDEWYYHMRFVPNLEGVQPILSALPPKETLQRPNGPHSGNPFVRAAVGRGEAQHVMWTYQRPGGGRGFGFTGAHFHRNWGDDNFRKLVLNAILWIAQAEVPAEGVTVTLGPDAVAANLDDKKR